MDQLVRLNYWAVLIAGVAYFILGALWYSPVLFGNPWMKGIGKSKEQVQKDFSPWKIVAAFVGAMIVAYGIGRTMLWMLVDTVSGGIIFGLLASICFTAATFGVNDVMEGRPSSLTLINVLYHVVGFVGMAIIIGAWGITI